MPISVDEVGRPGLDVCCHGLKAAAFSPQLIEALQGKMEGLSCHAPGKFMQRLFICRLVLVSACKKGSLEPKLMLLSVIGID